MLYRKSSFSRFAQRVSILMGNPIAFITAVAIIIVWGLSGPIFHFSDTWQLIVNTSTTIITFLMVFLIQNTQNRDNEAIQIKLDELIRSVNGAHNGLLGIEELTDKELNEMRDRYSNLAQLAREELRKGNKDTGTPQI
ncbi:MAG TPA: low affinity iron permease family protein [Ktedonobacteraceae bacterium]|nr:low affinity iron permease family protein [Ktedonobacteraceae bacterium]